MAFTIGGDCIYSLVNGQAGSGIIRINSDVPNDSSEYSAIITHPDNTTTTHVGLKALPVLNVVPNQF
jgi:hypothetical protein